MALSPAAGGTAGIGRLHGKTALTTGAARGTGTAIARAFIGGASLSKLLDVREEADWMHVIKALLSVQGALDILVNNAGITGFEEGPRAHDPEHAELEDWRDVHHTNLDGVFLGCKHAMRTTAPGSIFNVASRSGVVGIPFAIAYASSKAAVQTTPGAWHFGVRSRGWRSAATGPTWHAAQVAHC